MRECADQFIPFQNGYPAGPSTDHTMECSICTNAINESSGSVRTSCNHTFHFGCLATWASQSQSCPLCRKGLNESEHVQELSRPAVPPPHVFPADLPPSFRNLAERLMEGHGHVSRAFARDSAFGRTRLWTPRIREELRNLYATIPEHSADSDVAFVVHHAQVPEITALKYLLYFNRDPIETVICFVTSDVLPIPAFRPRDRGPEEEYVPRRVYNNNFYREEAYNSE